MIAIGGAIGVGLFLGSNVTINQAGPAVLLTYVLGAAVSLVVAYSLAEMAVIHPVAGAFGIYAEKYLNPWFGFTVRATYGLIQIVAIGAEVTAVAIYFQYWFPNSPQWFWVALVSSGIIAINAAQVGNFGEFEYWFALIKVIAIIAFIVVGVGLILGVAHRPPIGFRNLTAYGGFMPHGVRGMWLALTIAISSYMGVEVIAVTAGEARQPEKAIPRAMRTIVFRLPMRQSLHTCDFAFFPTAESRGSACTAKSSRTGTVSPAAATWISRRPSTAPSSSAAATCSTDRATI